MARPTTWRRSWNLSQGVAFNSSVMDLLVVQPGETLGGVWWTYKLSAGPFASTEYLPGSSTTIMGITLVGPSEATPSPLANSGDDWLWWEPVTWHVAAAGSTDYVWVYSGWGPRSERKIESMRKGDPAGNSTLRVVMETDQQDGSQGFTNGIRVQTTVSALIILP